jgi:hypothetical protein
MRRDAVCMAAAAFHRVLLNASKTPNAPNQDLCICCAKAAAANTLPTTEQQATRKQLELYATKKRDVKARRCSAPMQNL